jgi:isocitrate dehydrogenase kinase/phosphatase
MYKYKQLLTQYEMEQLVDELLKGYKYKLSYQDLKTETRYIANELHEALLAYAVNQSGLKPEKE